MRNGTGIARRGVVMVLLVLGLMTIAINSATARELCELNPDLGLADLNGDGVVSRGEIQTIINAAGDSEDAAQLQGLLDQLPADITGIRYQGCTPGEDGTGDGGENGGNGTGDGGTGDGGSGDGEGGTGTGEGGAETSASGTDTSTAAGDSGTGDGAAAAFDAITGLPDTGQGSAIDRGGVNTIAMLGIACLIALLGAYAIRARLLPE